MVGGIPMHFLELIFSYFKENFNSIRKEEDLQRKVEKGSVNIGQKESCFPGKGPEGNHGKEQLISSWPINKETSPINRRRMSEEEKRNPLTTGRVRSIDF
ncbi:hypothetical protein CEXT_467821 [Caerostris extrusa]|uniref:Uncharacterized protein n=1 Tax=Caerostris extrusa TaxID=172846 RepID=A0AAV4MPZ2_CAEEX|nr:hypothetical protein CEXT_467821 [Caerostris extrusa]